MKEHPKHFDTATESNGHQTSVRPIHIHFLAHSLYGQQIKRLYAVELREMLTKLGPSFIKFGQAMSIRPDLLPSSFLFELQKLCDAVPSFPTHDAIGVIESELGIGVNEVFEGIQTR